MKITPKQHAERLKIIKEMGDKGCTINSINRAINRALNTTYCTKATEYWFDKVFIEIYLAKLLKDNNYMKHCRNEYLPEANLSEEEVLLDDMFAKATKYKIGLLLI